MTSMKSHRWILLAACLFVLGSGLMLPDPAVAQRRNAGGRGLFGGGEDNAPEQRPARNQRSSDSQSPRFEEPAAVPATVPALSPAANPVATVPVAMQQTVELLAPKENTVPSMVTVGDSKLARTIGAELDALLAETTRKLKDSTREDSLTDVAREEFCAKYLTADMDAAQTKALRNALIDFDADTAELLSKKLGIPRRAIDTVLPQARFGGLLYELEKMVRSEDSIEKVDAFARRFQTSTGDFNLERAKREQVTATVDSIMECLRIRLMLTEKPKSAAGSNVAAPEGVLPAIMHPPLTPANQVFLLGDGVLVMGKGEPGNLVVARARAMELLNLPRGKGEPVAAVGEDAARKPLVSGTVIYNPPDMGQPVKYSINGNEYTVQAGQSQPLPAGTTWVIAFDRGNGTQARYTLAEGTYCFTNKNKSLELEARPCAITLENPMPSGVFHFVVDNQHVELDAGTEVSLKSKFPIFIGFQEGPGGSVSYKKLWGGRYQVALREGSNLWDLYEAAGGGQQPPPVSAAK